MRSMRPVAFFALALLLPVLTSAQELTGVVRE
jgi:hypothetical protein